MYSHLQQQFDNMDRQKADRIRHENKREQLAVFIKERAHIQTLNKERAGPLNPSCEQKKVSPSSGEQKKKRASFWRRVGTNLKKTFSSKKKPSAKKEDHKSSAKNAVEAKTVDIDTVVKIQEQRKSDSPNYLSHPATQEESDSLKSQEERGLGSFLKSQEERDLPNCCLLPAALAKALSRNNSPRNSENGSPSNHSKKTAGTNGLECLDNARIALSTKCSRRISSFTTTFDLSSPINCLNPNFPKLTSPNGFNKSGTKMESCWADTTSDFFIRSKSYLQDKKKKLCKEENRFMELVGFDIIETAADGKSPKSAAGNKRSEPAGNKRSSQKNLSNQKNLDQSPKAFAQNEIIHYARHPRSYVQKLRKAGEKRFLFLVNWRLPPIQMVNIYALKEGLDWKDVPAAFKKFVKMGEDSAKNNFGNYSAKKEEMDEVFKVIPTVVDGPWLVKKSVGSIAAIIGKKLRCDYFVGKSVPGSFKKQEFKFAGMGDNNDLSNTDTSNGENIGSPNDTSNDVSTSDINSPNCDYLEVSCDICSSIAAKTLAGMIQKAAKTVVIDLAYVIEAKEEKDLPEQLISGFRLVRPDLKVCTRKVKI